MQSPGVARRIALLSAGLLTVCSVIVACTTATAATIVLPPVHGRFDYQLGGSYAPAASVQIVDRDRSDQPVPGRYDICYVNAFQTQPGELRFWERSHRDLLLRNRHGSQVVDPGWPDERILDISTAQKRSRVAAIVDRWIDGCKASGFQAVEPDNIDSWTRQGVDGALTEHDAIAYATLLAARAHEDGLAIAQKNADELGSAGKRVVGFDFAIAEECQVYAECGSYTSVYGDHVIEIEYTDDGARAFARACAARGRRISIILRDRDVVPRGASGYRYQRC